ncbi:MAG: hypothetical protein K2H98_01580 [Duncaniella sp.]|nr:hypothetical protein [Duncaniella sp.]
MERTYDYDFIVTAADCNAQRELSISTLATYIIDTATGHANQLGVGFDRMISLGISWVLSRVSVELTRPAKVGGRYRLRTWVASLNRLFSERNFVLIDLNDNEPVGYARTIWMAINMESRTPGDLSSLQELSDAITDLPCPIAPQGKITIPELGDDANRYTFAVSDIDVNRHVTTRRYCDLITDCWPLEMYEKNHVKRFDIAFKHEAHYGETARYGSMAEPGEGIYAARIDSGEHLCTLARLVFTPR